MTSVAERYESLKRLGLKLDLTRGQPGDDNFDLSNPMLDILDARQVVTPSGVALRNYPGGVAGLKEARELLAPVIGTRPEETIVGNNASLQLMSNTLMWAMLKGLRNSPQAWSKGPVRFVVTVPGYDRHFTMLERLGIEMVTVPMTGQGPDAEAVARIAAEDASVKGMFLVPTYSNPTGETVSDDVVRRLASMGTAAPDFTLFVDDAYAVHHLVEPAVKPLNFLTACKEAKNPDRAILFGSTSKITFAGAGLGFMGASAENIAYLTGLMGTQMITPNKIEQYRHVLFLDSIEGGIPGLMRQHARLLKPKFDAVDEILTRELGGTGLATWTKPTGGYFVSLDTARPVADRVVGLAKQAGVALTPAGATYPYGKDPNNRNIRLSPTRPPVAEVSRAMEVVAVCVKLASEAAA